MHSFIRFSPFTVISLFSLFTEITGESLCTNGRLFVADTNTSSIYYFDLDGELEALAPVGTLLDEIAGVAGQSVYSVGDNEIAVVHRGTVSSMYEDGSIHFYRVGTMLESHGDHVDVQKNEPSELQNAKINCARATHVVEHHDKIAIFCDGFFNPDPSGTQVNTTVYVVDKTRFAFTAEPTAITHTAVLQGSHHGVAIPVDDDHLLVSVALPERVARVENSSALPSGFVVQDYEGGLLHDLNVADDKDRSCAGFHGSAAVGGKMALGCDATHGGILLVDYEPTTAAYTSRSLIYPEGFADHRVGSFLENPLARHMIGNFNGAETFNMFAFDPTLEAITKDHILALPAKPCSSAYELAEAEVIFTLLITGVVQVYEFHDTWELLSQVEVIPGMTDCKAAFMTPGYGQAFVFERAAMKMYAIDATELLHSLHDGATATALTDSTTGLSVSTTSLAFMPYSAAVSGVPNGYECVAQDDDDDHDHSAPLAPATSPSAPEFSPEGNGAESLATTIGAMSVLALSVMVMAI